MKMMTKNNLERIMNVTYKTYQDAYLVTYFFTEKLEFDTGRVSESVRPYSVVQMESNFNVNFDVTIF